MINPIQRTYAGVIPGHGIVEHTGRRSVDVNLEIVRRNCALGADIARAWAELSSGR